MDHPEGGEINNKTRKYKNRKGRIRLGYPFQEYEEDFVNMVSEFDAVWDGHLGWSSIAILRIELTSDDNRPIHAAPYRAGPKPQEFERSEIERMLAMTVIEPAQTEWAA